MSTLKCLLALILFVCSLAEGSARVQLTLDTSEADGVLQMLAQRAGGKPITDAQWQELFNTEPYKRLKVREQKIAEQFNAPSNVLKDEDFQKFVMSDDLLKRALQLRETLEHWKKIDLEHQAEGVLNYLPGSAVIRAKVFPMIKPNTNSFVWETSTNPAIFLYLDPDITAEKFANTVAHELHHIGLANAQAAYEERIKSLPKPAETIAEWIAAFGEGMAMLAAAGGPDIDPHAASTPQDHARWEHDLANFNNDLPQVNAFFLDVLNGKFANEDAISEKGSSFFGTQGPWYTVGYKMSVIVEKRFGREALIQTMLDPRKLLFLYNKAATEQNQNNKVQLPLWSTEILKEVQADTQ